MWCLEFVIFYGSVLYKLNKLSQNDLEKNCKSICSFALLWQWSNPSLKRVLFVKALESPPWSINLNRISRGSLDSPPLLKFSTRRVWPGFLDTTIPLLSKALDGCPAFLLSRTRQFLCPWGSTQQSFLQEGSAPRPDILPFFVRKSTPLVRPTKRARRGGGGGYVCL